MEFDYKNYKGFLKKKSSHSLIGWQKRYFQILDGKIIVYSLNEKDLNSKKGHFKVSQISKATSVDKTIFKFTFEERDFIFKAEDEPIKDKWIRVINHLVDEYKSNNFDLLEDSHEIKQDKKPNGHKMDQNLDKKSFDLLRNHGFLKTEVNKLSNEFLFQKGINKLLNIKDPQIGERIHYGFMFKYEEEEKIKFFEQKWFFICSQRPLSKEKYDMEYTLTDEIQEKEWLKFNCLFYFKLADDETLPQGKDFINLLKIIKIDLLDKEGKYYIILDDGKKTIKLCSDLKGERDQWNNVFTNVIRTIKEYQASMTKHPKNITYLYQIFKKGGINKLKEKLTEEKYKIIGDFWKM